MSPNVELNNLIDLYNAYKSRETLEDAKINKQIILNNLLSKIIEMSSETPEVCEGFKREQKILLDELSNLGVHLED